MKLINSGSTIGILGGGQLGRMTAQAAQRLGYKAHIFAQNANEPACQVTPLFTLGDFNDEKALKGFAAAVQVVTLEWENIPTQSLDILSASVPVFPQSFALKITQDRLLEKECARSLNLNVADFMAVQSAEDAQKAGEKLGFPYVLKNARMGYDGKGQAIIRDKAQSTAAWAELKTTRAIAESFVTFEREISVIVARRADGVMKTYPVAENIHKNGILDETRLPATITPTIEKQALHMATALCEKLNIVGLLAVEMFVKDGNVLMNEMAPRPHNSGHWTMDFSETSQFEQLIRAICGLPLGATTLTAPCMMKNLIGDDVKAWQKYLEQPGAHLHLYGKTEAHAGRKMGHVNMRKN
jgi:5-(carboxyamino)imidazole ribonucleotide synthase